jgi:hypothetical protein
MSPKKKINIIFIIQRTKKIGFKDIDHMLPFLYFLSKNEEYEYTAKGFIFGSETQQSKNIDARVKLLSNLKNIELVFTDKENFLKKAMQFLTPDSNSKPVKLLNKVLNKIIKQSSKSPNRDIDWKTELGNEFINSNMPLIFVLHNDHITLEIVSKIKKQNKRAKCVLLPHGTTICDNQMVSETDLGKSPIVKQHPLYKVIDYSLKTSKRDKNDEVFNGFKDDRSIIIGSPRYCSEWIKIKSNLNLDGAEVRVNSNYNIKVLFLIPKKNINIFSEELIRTIDFISSYEEIELVLLNYNSHFPNMPDYIINKNNISQYLISEKYSTSKLIDWADIIFHAGTGVIFESFMKEKITVLPRYLSCNTLISDKYNAGFNLSNRDELRTLCNAAVASLNNLKNDYREKCELANKKFIDDFVHANSLSVQQNITKTITYIINNFETLKQ